jgi:hypothetical protein
MSLHLKHATKLAMIKGIVDESFIITQYRFTVTPIAGAKGRTCLAAWRNAPVLVQNYPGLSLVAAESNASHIRNIETRLSTASVNPSDADRCVRFIEL